MAAAEILACALAGGVAGLLLVVLFDPHGQPQLDSLPIIAGAMIAVGIDRGLRHRQRGNVLAHCYSVQERWATMSGSHSIATPAVRNVTPQATTDLRVLVADPNDRSRARRRSQLCESGYLVTLARTSFEAIVKACCQLPDLVVLDDSLGNLEVEETARLLATCPATAHIPVVRLGSGRRLPQRVLTRLQRAAV